MADYENEGMSEEFESSAGASSVPYNDIPDYATCDETTRARLDEIIDPVDPYNSEDMNSFGDDVLADLQEVTDKIISAMANEEHGVFREPIQECLDDLRDVDLETLQDHISRAVGSTVSTVKNNKGATALAVTGLLTGQFWLTVGSGGFAAGKEYLKKHGVQVRESMQSKKLVRRDGSMSMEAIDERIRDALVKTKDNINKLQFADRQVPKLVSRINDMAHANRDVYYGTTLYLGAGREIARRIHEKLLPEARETFSTSKSFDDQCAIDNLTESAEVLDHKLQILEQARTESVLSTQNLKDMKDAINKNRHSLKSLLTSEVPTMNRTLAVAGMALDTYRTTSVTDAFRNHLDRLTEDSVQASKHAVEAADRGQIGNPERLERVIKRTIAFRNSLENRQEAIEQMSDKIHERRKILEQETSSLMIAQARNAEREMNRRLEGSQGAGQNALPNAAAEQDNAPKVQYGVQHEYGAQPEGAEKKRAGERKRPGTTYPGPS